MNPLSTPQSKKSYAVARSHSSDLQLAHPCSRVRVIVRVRPFLPHENSKKNDGLVVSCISAIDPDVETSDEVTVHLKDQESSRNECYKLDGYFGPEDNNVTKIFQQEVRPLLPQIFQGCNATVFAYGATGSGKTYTMQGPDERSGVISLAINTILSMCQGTASTVKISYYEIYMDKCYDLLEVKEKEIMVLDDKDGNIHLKGLAQHQVNSISEFNDVFSCIIQRRKVANTLLNDASSRSHAVIVVTVSTASQDCKGNDVIGKLSLIDLAGNEDNRKTSNEGIRLQESAKINQSLFALSNVIYALNNGKPHVPYRESKLTRILQDSLGGTSRSLMVSCLNPGEYMESVNTVSLAARSRRLSNPVSSAKKKDTPKLVDMETKLQAWLESKGKSRNGQNIGGFGSPFVSKTPITARSIKDTNAGLRSAKPNLASNQCSLASGKRVTFEARRNLFGGGMDSATKVECVAAKKEAEIVVDMVASESKYCADYDDTTIEEENTASSKCSGRPVPDRDITKVPETQLRKVLSPINSNTIIGNNTPLGGRLHLSKSPFVILNNVENESVEMGTPLDKFQTHSCGLKSSLVQEYLEFLNNASRDELIELKGIGQKYSEYIIELREERPLKSLNDLEKLGLSSKQVHNMFKKAARSVLE